MVVFFVARHLERGEAVALPVSSWRLESLGPVPIALLFNDPRLSSHLRQMLRCLPETLAPLVTKIPQSWPAAWPGKTQTSSLKSSKRPANYGRISAGGLPRNRQHAGARATAWTDQNRDYAQLAAYRAATGDRTISPSAAGGSAIVTKEYTGPPDRSHTSAPTAGSGDPQTIRPGHGPTTGLSAQLDGEDIYQFRRKDGQWIIHRLGEFIGNTIDLVRRFHPRAGRANAHFYLHALTTIPRPQRDPTEVAEEIRQAATLRQAAEARAAELARKAELAPIPVAAPSSPGPPAQSKPPKFIATRDEVELVISNRKKKVTPT
jgi:hypothetical protein